MLRRSERISNKYQITTSYHRLCNLTDKYKENINTNGSTIERIYIIKNMYMFVYNYFYQMRHEVHKEKILKEEYFLSFITIVEKRGKILLDQLTKIENIDVRKLNTIKENIIKTNDKIKKYMDIHNNEKKNVFILLSAKIGTDLAYNIKSYV
jgi:hypothetical protein